MQFCNGHTPVDVPHGIEVPLVPYSVHELHVLRARMNHADSWDKVWIVNFGVLAEAL